MNRKITAIVTAILLVWAACPAQNLMGGRGDNPLAPPASITTTDVPDDEEDVIFILSGEADKAIADGDYATAETRLVEALSLDRDNPSNVLLLSNLGMVYSYQDKDSLALATLTEALRRAPSMTTVLNNRAMVYLHLGDDAAAMGDFGRAISLDSLNLTARYYHGLMSLYSGDLATARADLQVLRDNDPESLATATAMAALLSMTGNDREAIHYYTILIEKDPAPEYYAALAGCHLALGELSEAARVIADGMERYTSDPELYYYRAWLNRDSYLLDKARDDARTAKRLGADPRKVDRLFE